MKRNKYLAMLAALILGVAGPAFAQEGYFGQRAANQPAAQTDSGAQIVACVCGHMHGDGTPAMRALAPPTTANTSTNKQVGKKVPPKDRGKQGGDPNASQNHVEYSGA